MTVTGGNRKFPQGQSKAALDQGHHRGPVDSGQLFVSGSIHS